MEKVTRKLFFWSLVLLFFITAPLVILRTQGYRFDWNRGVFVYSGSITIKSNPQNFDLLLNGKPRESKSLDRINSAYNIGGLIPDDYVMKLTAPGFRPWSKKTDVHSGVSSEFWNVLLVRENYETESYNNTEDIDNFYISPQDRYIAYTKQIDDNLILEILDIDAGETIKSYTLAGWKLLDESQKENVEWSPEEDYLSIPVEKSNQSNSQSSYFVINPEKDNIFNLNELIKRNHLRKVRWDSQDKDYLFFLQENSVFRVNVADPQNIKLIAEEVTSFDVTKEHIYYLQLPNNLVFRTSLDATAQREQITSNFPDNSSSPVERMIIYDDGRMAFINNNKNLFIYNKADKDTYFRKLGDYVEDAHFSDDGKKLLFWTNHEISTYFLRDWEVQPARMENELTNVTRYGEILDNVQWHKDYEHIIFSVGPYTKIIELDGRDRRNCMDLISTSLRQPFVRYDKALEILYFTDIQNGKTYLHSIIFPEPAPILGFGG